MTPFSMSLTSGSWTANRPEAATRMSFSPLAAMAVMFAHGQGLDMVERPAFSADETLTLEENMFFAVHPAAVTESVFGAACDNFLVTANGVERITQTPHGVLCC